MKMSGLAQTPAINHAGPTSGSGQQIQMFGSLYQPTDLEIKLPV